MEARLAGAKSLMTQPRLPCETHGRPELWPENLLAWKLWQMAMFQVTIFPGKTQRDTRIELKYEAVIPLIGLYIEDHRGQQETLEKIVLCQQVMLSRGIFDFFRHGDRGNACIDVW